MKAIPLILVILFIVFFVGPAFVAYILVFGKKNVESYRVIKKREIYYLNYKSIIDEAKKFYESASCERVSFKSIRDTIINGYYFNNASQNTVVLLHGYMGNPRFQFAAHLIYLIKKGFNVLTVDMRAHGLSGGSNTTLGIIESIDLIDIIKSINEKNIVLWGISMGATSIFYGLGRLSQCEKVKCIIAENGYVSVAKQITFECKKRHLPYFVLVPIISILARVFLRINIYTDIYKEISNNTIPILFISSGKDYKVSKNEFKNIYKMSNFEKEWLEINDAEHTTAFLIADDVKKDRILKWIKIHF